MARSPEAPPIACLLRQQRKHVLWLTLNRPDRHNALNAKLVDDLRRAVQDAGVDPDVRVVVITGSGEAFCTGADLQSLVAAPGPGGAQTDFLSSAEALSREMREFHKPLIACLNGLTCAGGLEIAMCCDLIFAAESARLADAHVNFAAFPGGGGACILPRRIGLMRAKYLLFTGDFVSASFMKDWGLINEVIADENLRNRVDSIAQRIAEKSPPVLSAMKVIANRTEYDDVATGLAAEQRVLAEQISSADFQEGVSAFREKRRPIFKGH